MMLCERSFAATSLRVPIEPSALEVAGNCAHIAALFATLMSKCPVNLVRGNEEQTRLR